MRFSHFKKIILPIIGGLVVLLPPLILLPNMLAIKIILIFPFIFFFPGWFIIQTIKQSDKDQIEQITLSVLLSMSLVFLGLFLLEKLFSTFFPGRVFITIGLINLGCLSVFLLRDKLSGLPGIISRGRNKINQWHQK